MQDILPPSRGRIRPVLRTNPQRVYPSTLRRPATPSPAPTPAPVVTPQPSPSNPNPLPIKHHQPHTPAKRPSQPVAPAKASSQRSHHRLSKVLSRTAYKLHLIHRLNERQQQPHKVEHTAPQKRIARIFKPVNKRSLLTGATIAVILIITGYISFDTWQTNNLAKQAFTQEAAASEPSTIPTDRQSNEGKDESSLPESALANYRVASNLPRALYINKINVSARVLPMGVNNDGSMQAPLGIYDAGWYTGSVRPGETGATVLNGHSSGPTRQGLLGRLDTLKQGDEIVIEKGDKTRLTYRVEHTETVPLAAVDMNKVMLPYGTAKHGLNIYSCTGEWLPSEQTFDHRVIIYTVEV